MTETELLSIVDTEEKQSLGHGDGDLSKEREEALRYYNGEKYGNEEEGRSQVVTTEVANTVEWILPSLLKIFTSSDKAVEFQPEQPSDEEGAKQATDACNYVFYRQNPGFLCLYSFFKDALIQKNGYLKVWYEKSDKKRKESYRGLTQAQLQQLVASDGVEILGVTSYPDPAAPVPAAMPQAVGSAMGAPVPQAELYDVQIEVTKAKGKVCISPVPPEEMRISAKHNTISLQDSPFTAQICRKTISELKAMGFDTEALEIEGYEDNLIEESGEYLARREFEEETTYGARGDSSSDPTMRSVWVTEAYIRVDYDGDGVAELRKVIKTGRTILENEEVDVVPFAAITPMINTHRHYGKSVAEMVMDLQLIKTTLTRQSLDNVYLTNSPRMAVLANPDGTAQANLDDLLTVRPGGIVREYAPNATRPITVPFMAQHGLQMMEYMDAVLENRTGVTRYNQGIDANSLNKTATGISQIMSASQQRIELIARIFAETGVKTLFNLILHCLATYSDKAMLIRLRDEFVEVDPRAWANGFDMTINVGLGTGNKDQQLVHLNQIAQAQFAMLQAGLPIVTPENIYKAQAKIVENAGFKNVEDFWKDPSAPPDPNEPPPPPPPPDPMMLKMQAEQQAEQARMQMDAQKAQQDAQLSMQKAQSELQLKAAMAQQELAMERERIAAQIELERWKAQQEAELAIYKAQLQSQVADNANQRQAMQAPEPEEKDDGPDSSEVLATALNGFTEVVSNLNRPKRVIRDESGRVAGVE